MKKIILPLSIALAQMLAVSAFAQTPAPGTGENSAPAVAPAGPKATPAEKAAARANRKVEGAEAPKGGEVSSSEYTKSKNAKTTKAQRKAAHAKRKAAAAAEVKSGEIKTGEGATAK